MSSEIACRMDVHRQYLLSANQRLHWREKAWRTTGLRQDAYLLSRGPGITPYDHRVRLVVHVSYPDARRRDVHNLMPTVKACIDGLVDAGWLTDDSDKFLQGPDLRPTDERCDKGLACSLTFEFEEIAQTGVTP